MKWITTLLFWIAYSATAVAQDVQEAQNDDSYLSVYPTSYIEFLDAKAVAEIPQTVSPSDLYYLASLQDMERTENNYFVERDTSGVSVSPEAIQIIQQDAPVSKEGVEGADGVQKARRR